MISRKRIIENIFSLAVLNGVNYLLPMITLPYLVRVLGLEKFGLLAFAQAFMQYLVVFTDYGFNLTATRQIAIYRNEQRNISRIFSTVMLIKLGLLLISFLLMVVIVFSIPKFRSDWAVYFVAFLFVAGNVLFPMWFFLGMERMRYITVLNVISGAVSAIAIFTLVHSQSDYLLAAGCQAGRMMLTGILGLWLVKTVAPVRVTVPSLQESIATLRDGWHVFLSTASVQLDNSSVLILGLFHGNVFAGYFSVADKIIKAAIGLSGPILIAIYPRVSALIVEARAVAITFLRKTLLFGGITFLTISVALFIGAGFVTRLATGEVNDSISILIRIMAVVPLTVFIDNIYGTQIMVTLGMKKQFVKAILYSSSIFLLSSFLLVPPFATVGSALAYVASRIAAMILMIVYVCRAGIRLHRR